MQPHPVKTFFSIVFGGLIALFATVGMFNVGIFAWRTFGHAGKITVAETADASDTTTGSILGMRTSVQRYSASDEEDLINAAASALLHGQVDRVTAKAYLVRDLTQGQTIIGNNADTLLPI
ncbi:MAG: hypothetical protein PHG25_03690, partial [Candidatus Pacebacteria bacterium]|nr:hypothetical protein [Candidatus Paceibacterota bacterium]